MTPTETTDGRLSSLEAHVVGLRDDVQELKKLHADHIKEMREDRKTLYARVDAWQQNCSTHQTTTAVLSEKVARLEATPMPRSKKFSPREIGIAVGAAVITGLIGVGKITGWF
jgi:hypothetical protein